MELPTEKQRLKYASLNLRDSIRAFAEHVRDEKPLNIPHIHELPYEIEAAQEMLEEIQRKGLTEERLRILEAWSTSLIDQVEQTEIRRRFVC